MFTTNELPTAVGFGKLNMLTIIENAEKIVGVYEFHKIPVHSITYLKGENAFEVEDIYPYQTGLITFSYDLIKAVISHFDTFDCITNSIYNLFKKTIVALGNISVENLASMNDDGGTFSYYPAGRHILLRLPVVTKRNEDVIANIFIKNTIWVDFEHKSSMKLLEIYNTYILIAEDREISYLKPILIFEYIVPLYAVHDAIKWLIANDLIETEKVLRLAVQDAKEKLEHSFETYDDELKSDSSFSLLYKGENEKEISFNKLKEQVEDEFDYKL